MRTLCQEIICLAKRTYSTMPLITVSSHQCNIQKKTMSELVLPSFLLVTTAGLIFQQKTQVKGQLKLKPFSAGKNDFGVLNVLARIRVSLVMEVTKSRWENHVRFGDIYAVFHECLQEVVGFHKRLYITCSFHVFRQTKCYVNCLILSRSMTTTNEVHTAL